MEEKPSLDEAGERDLKRLRGELGAARRTRSDRERAYWISALEAQGAAAQLRPSRRHDPARRRPVVDRRGDRRAQGHRRAVRPRQPHRPRRARTRGDVLRPRHVGRDRRGRPGDDPQPGHRRPAVLPGMRLVRARRAGCDGHGLPAMPRRRRGGLRPGAHHPAVPPGLGLRLPRARDARRRHRRAPPHPLHRAHHGRRRSATTSSAPPGSSTATRSAPRCCGRPTSGG